MTAYVDPNPLAVGAGTDGGHRVRLVAAQTALFASCPRCGGPKVADGKPSIEIDGVLPCDPCCAELVGGQRFVDQLRAAETPGRDRGPDPQQPKE